MVRKYRILSIIVSCITWILVSTSLAVLIYSLISAFLGINYEILFLSLILILIVLIWGITYMEYVYQYLNWKSSEEESQGMPIIGMLSDIESESVRDVIQRYKSRIKEKPKPTKIFKINEYITLKLENDNTHIYVNDKIFLQCKYLLLNISPEQLKEYNKIIKSIDDVAELLDHSLEDPFLRNFIISPEQGFMAHCSNIQAWVECDYDTRILHSNMSFPLLKKLVEVGDIKAKKVFKEEIAKRFVEGNKNTRRLLNNGGYLNYLDIEDIITIMRIVLEKGGRISLNIDLSKRIGLIDDKSGNINSNFPSHIFPDRPHFPETEWDIEEDD